MEIINGRPSPYLGSNTSNNGVSTLNVTSNRDGSLLERSEWIIQSITGTGGLEVFKDGPRTIETNSKTTFSVSLIDSDSGSVATGNITPGTYTIYKSTAGGAWSTVATGSTSKSDSLIYIDYTFATLSWDEEDNFKVVFDGISASLSTQTHYIQDAIFTGRITRETDIEDKVDIIDSVVDATQASLTLSISKIDTIDTVVDSIKASTDKLSGSYSSGTISANWNSAEADICSVGTLNTNYKLHSLIIDMYNATSSATFTVRMYSKVNGTERKVYDVDFTKGTDPDGIWVVDGTVGIHNVLRITGESSAATDDGIAISYDYMLESM